MLNTTKRLLSWGEIIIIIVFSCIPLLFSFPYRINIFLSWDGAYRMSEGQIPFKDFGMPIGYGYWIIPAIFFKLFGPAMFTLIKAQVFINILSGLSFVSILTSLRIPIYSRLLSLLVFLISFSFFNFWPWYNHTVIVYELIALAFLFKYLLPKDTIKPKILFLILSSFFLFLSFFTKQDGGGLGLVLCLAILSYRSIISKKLMPLAIFLLSYIIIALIFILPLLPYGFGYWFNHGQPPHSSRLSAIDLVISFLGASKWIKFYLFLSLILLFPFIIQYKSTIKNERLMYLILLSFGVLAEAAIFQVTSYTPDDNNIFFHSFGFMFILALISELKIFTPSTSGHFILFAFLIALWWSDIWWKYIEKKIQRPAESGITLSPTGENIVNEKTFRIRIDSLKDIPQSKWVFSQIPVFKKISMPQPTVDGINRLRSNKEITSKVSNNRILNMSELTPLGYVMGFKSERGSEIPLWYHLGVGMFNKQKDMYCKRISQKYYDAVIFEYIPTLNNFYPFEVRDSLIKNYNLVDSFLAPRNPNTGKIEIYIKPSK